MILLYAICCYTLSLFCCIDRISLSISWGWSIMFQAGTESRPKVPCVKIGGPKGPVHFTNKLWKRAELQAAPENGKMGLQNLLALAFAMRFKSKTCPNLWQHHSVRLGKVGKNMGTERSDLFLRARIMQQFLRAGRGPTWGKSWSPEGTSKLSSPIPPQHGIHGIHGIHGMHGYHGYFKARAHEEKGRQNPLRQGKPEPCGDDDLAGVVQPFPSSEGPVDGRATCWSY